LNVSIAVDRATYVDTLLLATESEIPYVCEKHESVVLQDEEQTITFSRLLKVRNLATSPSRALNMRLGHLPVSLFVEWSSETDVAPMVVFCLSLQWSMAKG